MPTRTTDRTYARGYVVRRPTPADLQRRKPITVTTRDRRLLAALADFGFLSTELIVRTFFPPEAGPRGAPASVAYERLRLLWLWSLVERIELPVARVVGGRKPYLYTLAARGVPWVAERRTTGEGPVQRRRLDRVDERLLDHDLTVAAFWAHLVAGLRGSPAILERWVSETTVRRWREQARGYRRDWAPAAVPDGIGEIRYPDETIQSCVLEVDMGTETLRRFARKVRGFEAYPLSGWFRARFGYDTFEVVVVSPSEGRRDNLRHVAREVVPSERWGSYRFGTSPSLDSDDASLPCWVDLGNHWSPLLDPDAHPCTGPTTDHALRSEMP